MESGKTRTAISAAIHALTRAGLHEHAAQLIEARASIDDAVSFRSAYRATSAEVVVQEVVQHGVVVWRTMIDFADPGLHTHMVRLGWTQTAADLRILAEGYVGSLQMPIGPSTRLDYKTMQQSEAAQAAFNRIVGPYLKESTT